MCQDAIENDFQLRQTVFMNFSNTMNRSEIRERNESLPQVERIDVRFESGQMKIRRENYDEKLGWYVSGSLQLPDHLVPLLEQALQQAKYERTLRSESSRKILPFKKTCP